MEELENYTETYRVRPVLTTDEQSANCERLAYNLAEKRLADGTAKDPLIIHFLKLSTEMTKLEKEKLRADTQLALAKIEAASQAAIEAERTERVLQQLKRYQGSAYGGDNYDEEPVYFDYRSY